MRITVTARGCDLPAELRVLSREVVARLSKYAHRPQGAQVVFHENGLVRQAELLLRAARNDVFKARGEGPDFRTALDRARAKLRRQLDHAQRSRPRLRERA